MYKIFKGNNKCTRLYDCNFIAFINPNASAGAFKNFIHLINAWKIMKYTKKIKYISQLLESWLLSSTYKFETSL